MITCCYTIFVLIFSKTGTGRRLQSCKSLTTSVKGFNFELILLLYVLRIISTIMECYRMRDLIGVLMSLQDIALKVLCVYL